jgi:hypothetical protein
MNASVNGTSIDELTNRGYAYHEAGHAILFRVFGLTLTNISILPVNDAAGGQTQALGQHPVILQQMGVFYEGTPEQDQYICHHIMITQGGEVAQTEFCPESLQDYHARFDRLAVERLIKKWDRSASLFEMEEKIKELYRDTRQLLRNPLCVAAIHAVAGALLEQKQLTGEQARTLIHDAMIEATNAAKVSGEPPLELKCPHCANARYDKFDDR